MVTLLTVLAIAVAIAAFAVLPAKHGIPRDAYTIAADRICVNAKKQIGGTAERALRRPGLARTNAYASGIVLAVAEWRSAFGDLSPPTDRASLAELSDTALRDVEIGAGGLALAAQRRSSDVLSRARALDTQTQTVDRTIASLGLSDCAQIVIVPRVARRR